MIMKKTTKKVALWLFSTIAIMGLAISSTNAMYWQWRGLGQSITAEERVKLQSMSPTERQEYIQQLREKYNYNLGQSSYSRGQWMKRWGQGQGMWRGQGWQAQQIWHSQDPANLIANIPASEVSETEKEILINQYGEERMARDLYAYAAEKYPNVNTFANITKSEQEHMDALKVLLDRYGIEAPSDYAKDNDLFVTLKNKIDQSEKDAIEVGITVEMVDIDNIAEDIKNTDNDDFKVILTNIWGASYNHLRWFVQALQNFGYTTDLKWTDYISQEDLNVRWNALKTKLAEKLEAEGVVLPEQASSNYIKQNCNQNWQTMSTSVNNRRGQNFSNNTVYSQIETKKAQYKTLLNTKYKAKLDALSDDKLKAILPKIDALEEKVRTSTTYSETKKIQYIALLEALREVIQERVGDDMIDDLLQ